MRLPDLQPSDRRWDKFREFHTGYKRSSVATTDYGMPPFIFFETGEVLCTLGHCAPAERRAYGALGVEIVQVAVDGYAGHTLWTTDGRKVPKSWVGSQTLLIDEDRQMVVSLESAPYLQRPSVPTDSLLPVRAGGPHAILRHGAYWSNVNDVPQGAVPITLTMPAKAHFDKETMREIKERMKVIEMIYHHKGLEANPANALLGVGVSPERVLTHEPGELADVEILRAVRLGLASVQEEHKYLLTRQP